MKLLLNLLITLGCVNISSATLTVINSAYNANNGHQYYLLANSDWTQAEASAISLGGHLATINNQAENDWLFNLWGTGHSLWLGFNDAATEGSFVWANGETSTFTNWRNFEPNDGVGWNKPSEDYTYMIAAGFGADSGKWNDSNNVSVIGGSEPLLYGVVEVVPEPTTIGILLCGGLLLAKSARNRKK